MSDVVKDLEGYYILNTFGGIEGPWVTCHEAELKAAQANENELRVKLRQTPYLVVCLRAAVLE